MKRTFVGLAVSIICAAGLGCGGRDFADKPDARDGGKSDGGTDKPIDAPPGNDLVGDQTGDLPPGGCQANEHACNGTCLKNDDPTGCGATCTDCTGLPNVKPGAVQCQSDLCVVPADGCAAGHAHCSTNPADVCETDTTKPENCGGCGKKCTMAAPFCANVAGAPTCVLSCSGTTPDKCDTSCVDLKTDVNNCGTCGKVCNIPNAVALCMNGACVLSKCKDGFGDCNATDPGCETQLNSSANCGACGKSCAVTNGSAMCVNGTCGPVTCNAGFGNCDNNPDCETQLNSTANCGKCGMSCDATKPLCSTVNGQQTCVSDCTASAPMKCGTKCVDTKTDLANCATCGNACNVPANGTATCVDGSCGFTCNSNFQKCGTACIPNNAQCNGACLSGLKPCGTTCVSTATCCTNGSTGCAACAVCSAGSCNPQPDGTSCGSGMVCKGGSCGSCGNSGQACCAGNFCNAGLACNGGTCQPACVAGGACTTNPNSGNCVNGVWACASPTATRNCADDTTKQAAGSDCAGGKVCNTSGGCVSRCVAGGSCTTNANQQNCINGIVTCINDWSPSTCQDGAQKTGGSSCANGSKVCNASGTCVNKCQANQPCTTNDLAQSCRAGVTTCQSDLATPGCANGGNKPAGSTCNFGDPTKSCNDSGQCKLNDDQACSVNADCRSGLCRIRAGDGSRVCAPCGLNTEMCCPGPGAGLNFCTDGSSCTGQPDTQSDPVFVNGFCS